MEKAEKALTDDSERALAEFIRAERVRFVFIQAAIPIFFSPLAAAILSAALWTVVDQTTLVTWTSGLLVIAIMRVALIRAFARTTPGAHEMRWWERIFVASIVVVDLWWGIGGLFLLVPDGLAERGLVFCFIMVMAGGHTASYSAHAATVVLGVLSLTLPITILFWFEGDLFHRAMSFASVMYLLATLRSIKTLGFFFGRTHRLAHELQREKDRVEELARLDFLTSLNNRRAFYEQTQDALAYARRYAHPASLIMLDIDHFKSINDRYGHAAGDEVIRAMATLIRATLRGTDIAGRIGGEEFAVFLPETTIGDALAIAERIRTTAETTPIAHGDKIVRFTISIGVASLSAENLIDQLMVRADEALYAAKREGRNRVVAGEQPSPSLERSETRSADQPTS